MANCDNDRKCNCTYPCSRHGKCCECVAFHKKYGELPGCFFTQAGEASYDRSLEKLCTDRGGRFVK